MKVLWLSVTSGLFQDKSTKNYNGGGWVVSLQKIVQEQENVQLGLAFLSSTYSHKEKQGNTSYYPIYTPSQKSLAKLKEYYGGYKKINTEQYVAEINNIIQDFRPDVIHLFGMENQLATILGKTTIPIVVHLQGLLAPCDNAFFPIGLNKKSFLFPFSINEWILRNGYIYAKNNIHVRGEREKKLFKKVSYTMGRTNWDYQVSQLLAPQSQYYHVDEVLRDIFYQNAGTWELEKLPNKLIITSTISNTIYKGLDLILKTACLLKTETNIDFEWNVIGIHPATKIIRFFEKTAQIKSNEVNIHYKGVLNADELCNNLLKSHVYVHPSYIDNSPNSVCEAQLLGVPVIGTNVGGIPSLIKDGVNGILIPANAPYELAYHLKQLYQDKELSQKLSKQGFLTASQRHDRDKILTELIKTYQAIINNETNL